MQEEHTNKFNLKMKLVFNMIPKCKKKHKKITFSFEIIFKTKTTNFVFK